MRELALAAVSSATFNAETGRPLAASARAYFAAQTTSPILTHRLRFRYLFLETKLQRWA
ncbi:MAG: hypothetical protein ACHQ03_08125 [Candidatus Bathyarchaeia archaeon]